MQERSAMPAKGDILAFTVIVVLALGLAWAWQKFNPPPPQVANAPAAGKEDKKDDKAGEAKKAEVDKNAAPRQANEAKPGEKKPADKTLGKPTDEPVDQTAIAKGEKSPSDKSKPEAVAKPAPARPRDDDDRRWITMGSVDPDLKANPYRMLITLDRQGGALARLELSSERYRDLDDRSGYLGHLVMDNSDKGPGCLLQVVGAGTPAAKADIQAGDRIMDATYRGKTTSIDLYEDLEAVLRSTEPGEPIELTIRRGAQTIKKTVALIQRPLEVIRPEPRMPDIVWQRNGPLDATNFSKNCPASFLTTLQQIDDSKLRLDEDPNAKFDEEISRELPGVSLRDAMWKIESPQKGAAAEPATKVVFSCELPEEHLKVIKTYELEKAGANGSGEAYHLLLSVAIANNDTKKHEVAYRQDGPNGLPTEGWWYVTSKVSRGWSGEGLRDVVYELADSDVGVVACGELSKTVDKTEKFRQDIGESSEFSAHRPWYFGVDAQYFSVVMMPDAETTAPNIERAIALRVGDIEELRRTLTNTSCRLISKPLAIQPGTTCEPQVYEVFAGPKRPELLKQYGLPWRHAAPPAETKHDLAGLVYYGWFGAVAVPMTHVLEFFYGLVRNYGLAIIMLTVVVRLAMFPLSRVQTRNAQMMQKLQPEMKEIQKRFKKDPEGARKAQQELFGKHNYNPMVGCLPMLLQIPIFFGLYKALQVDVELRGAALIPIEAVRWCSNLAAPDMLWDWSRFMPNGVNNGIGFPGVPIIGLFGGMLGLGPYLNLFPIITICLYLIQQKVMMPPATDDTGRAQQKMMKYMMIFFGLMFFKIAAGLCIYFIATTLWSLAEKQLLPKPAPAGGGNDELTFDDPKPIKPLKPRLTDSERRAIRRQKKRK